MRAPTKLDIIRTVYGMVKRREIINYLLTYDTKIQCEQIEVQTLENNWEVFWRNPAQAVKGRA